jgi:hypothetical protein
MLSLLVQWTVSLCSVYWCSGQCHYVQFTGAVDSVIMFSFLVQWTVSLCSVYWCSGQCHYVQFTGAVDSLITFHIKE